MANHTERNLLHAYLDDELDLVRSMELEDHLVECGDCAHEVASYRSLRERVVTGNIRYQAPADFRLRLLRKLEEQKAPRAEHVSFQRRLPWWSWAAVAVCLLVTAVTLGLDLHQRLERNLMNEIVSD